MKVRYNRTAAYCKAKAIETGTNCHQEVEVEIDPAALSIEARTEIVNQRGIYPASLACLYQTITGGYSQSSEWPPVTSPLFFSLDAEPDDLSIEQVEGMILAGKEQAALDRQALEKWRQAKAVADQERQARQLEEKARALKAKELLEITKAEAKARRISQIKQWVAEYGSPSQKERMYRGLLPEQEIIDAMTDQAFSTMADLPAFSPVTESQLRSWVDMPEYGNGDIEAREFANLAPLSEPVFLALQAVEARAGTGADVSLIVHAYYWENQDWPELRRLSARVTKVVGEFELKREFALPGIQDWLAHGEGLEG